MGLIRARPRLASRLEALVRVDERRWDLRLKDGSIIQLPAVGEEEALIQLDKLDAGQNLLDLGFERIDLRSPDMVVVRRGPARRSAAALPGLAVGAAQRMTLDLADPVLPSRTAKAPRKDHAGEPLAGRAQGGHARPPAGDRHHRPGRLQGRLFHHEGRRREP